jgi:stage V sporulation protein K
VKDNRSIILTDSFYDISKDMKNAIREGNKESIQYNFLRIIRLLKKTENLIKQSVQSRKYYNLENIFILNDRILKQISKWKAELAYQNESSGEFEQAEKEWFDSLIFNVVPEHYIQYCHAALRNRNLFVNKEIKDNMESINTFNVSDVKICLKRARFVIKLAISIQGNQEATSYILSWIDLLEKAIEEREDLVQALLRPNTEVSLEATIFELQQLIGLKTVKRKIKEISDWVIFTQMRREQGLKEDELSLHMVFSGHPGTGKTTVARIIAKIFKALGVLKKGHLVEVGRSDLVAEYVGQTAIKTMKKIKEAEHGVLFIDEAYSLTRSGGNDFGLEAIDTLVKAMEDNRKNMVVILAGYPEEMNNFIQSNPGLYSRFKYHIDFQDYSLEELMKILNLQLKEKQYKITDSAKSIAKIIIENAIKSNPTLHGNGRLVRNLIEDVILNKAALVVQNKQDNLPTGSLDIIDETIMKMVEVSLMTKEEHHASLNNRAKL